MSNYSSEKLVKAINRKIRRKYSAEEKILIVLDGLRVEDSIAQLFCREGINQKVYYRLVQRVFRSGKTTLIRRYQT